MSVLKYRQSKTGKSELLSCFFTISIVFADILGNGNFNLLYFFGAFLVIRDLKIRISFLKDFLIFFVPFLIMILGEICFSGNTFSLNKVLAYSVKILVCISLLSYVKNNFWRVDHLKIINHICQLFGALLVLSILTIKLPVFWRLNDEFNSFAKVRLQFLYSEPSVLGVLCGILVVILMYYIFNNKDINRIIIKEVLLLAVIILLTFSMSGIVYTIISVMVLYLFQISENKKHIPRRLLRYSILGLCAIAFILMTNNPISTRFFSMFLGMDGSYNFRWSAAVSTFSKTMEITKKWGMGLGNMNTASGLSFLLDLGIDYKFANSFLYFLTENGFLGFLYIVYLLLICIYACIKSSKSERPLRIGLLVFAFISQIAGGYFTDPILWMLYGIICSKNMRINNTMINREYK
ncbi:MAG: hypothetical protein JTJ28_08850 [Lactobacillus sp.]|nr:hypothetical protein [Lactobacillus sp.]